MLSLLMVAVMAAGLMPLATPTGVAALVLAPPTLTAPASGATVSGNPVFAWTAVSDAVNYRIEISQNPGFSSTVVADETQSLRYAPASELPLGTLYWRVAARDAGNTLGTWQSATFAKQWGAAPNPLTPAPDATLVFPTDPLLFTWDALAGAQSYELQVDDAIDFIGATTYTTRNTSYVITDPKTNGQSFFWRVRGVAADIYSDYSPMRQLTFTWPSVPTLVSPANGATVTDIEFDWDPVPGARTYDIQVSPNGDWANNITFSANVKGTRYSNPTSLNNGSYFWRVRAVDAANNNGAWSAERQLTRAWSPRPVLVSPVNGDVNVGQLTFTWEPIRHAAYYQLEWSTDPNFFPNVSFSCYTNRTTVTPYGAVLGGGEPGSCNLDIAPGATIYWHVRGIDPPVLNPGAGEPGVLGLWSNASNLDLWSFVYMPAAAAQDSPASGSTLEVPTLRWDDVRGAARYRVVIVDKNNNTTSADTFSTSYTPTSALNPANSPFRWYVRSFDSNGRLSVIPAQGSWWSFTLTAIATTYATPDPVGPANASATNDMPSLSWQPVTGASYYKVQYSPNGVVFSQLGPNTQYPAYTYDSSVLASGTYTWFVEAFNGSNVLIADSYATRRTFVIAPPDVLAQGAYVTPVKCPPASACDPVADTPTLTWDGVPGALSYRVYVAYDPNFTNMYRTYDTYWTRLSPRESYVDNQAGQAFYWFVRPMRSGNSGRFDSQAQQSASAFQKRSEGVHLAAPANLASVGDEIRFSWDNFLTTNGTLAVPVGQEARQYRVVVSTVADFASTIDTQIVDQTCYTAYDRTYPEGPIYWRVQAIDASNNSLTFSPARLVTKASAPVVQSYPADAALVPGVPYLRWDPQHYAASYTVQLDNDSNFSSPISTPTTSMTAWAYTDPLAAGTYYWRVRRNDADNRPGPWSAARTFDLAPAAPTLLSPANGANPSPTTLLLQWTAAQPTPRYSVELSTSSLFGTQLSGFPQVTVMSSWAPKTLLTNGTYYWRVKALNASGAAVATSAVFSFTVDSSRPSVTAISPSSAASLTSTFTVTFSESVTGIDDTNFRVTIAGTSTVVAGAVSVLSPTQARFTPATTLVPGQTYTVALSSSITDTGGNPLLPYAKNIRTSTTVQENSPAVREAWGRWTTASASGGSMKLSRKASSTLTFTFTGTAVALVGYKGTQGGYASLYLDGVLQTSSLSFYASTSQYRAQVWSTSGLSAGQHTLRVIPRGTKPAASKGTWVYVDAFLVDGVTTVQDNGVGVDDRFRRVSSSSASGSAYDQTDFLAATGRSGPTLSFQFKGTGISWYGTKGPASGKAYVYIDGSKKATIDLYRSSTAYRQKLWTSATLSNAVHTIKIVVVGSKRSTAKGYDVSFDSFTVR
jgi:hypothetical protein